MTDTGRRPLRFLVSSAALHEQSLNSHLARLAAQMLEEHGGTIDLARMAEFDVPSYDQDVQDGVGFPPGAQEFRRHIEASDAFVVSSPEYNAAMPGLLKSAIDWVSRFRPQPFNERHALLMSTSPSMVGGNRGLWTLRIPLESLGARVYPDIFSLAQAHQAFDATGRLTDAALGERFTNTIVGFMGLVEAAWHYPCIKSA